MSQLRQTSIGIAVAIFITACGGGGSNEQFSAPGIDTGSVSSQTPQSSASAPAGIPQIGAALASAPLNDDFDAVRFLHRTSFGPRDEDIDQLRDAGYANWIYRQMQLSPTFLMPLTRARAEPRWGELSLIHI